MNVAHMGSMSKVTGVPTCNFCLSQGILDSICARTLRCAARTAFLSRANTASAPVELTTRHALQSSHTVHTSLQAVQTLSHACTGPVESSHLQPHAPVPDRLQSDCNQAGALPEWLQWAWGVRQRRHLPLLRQLGGRGLLCQSEGRLSGWDPQEHANVSLCACASVPTPCAADLPCTACNNC